MRKILIVVDMQNDFIDGSLGSKEALSIVPNVIKKIKSYPSKDVIVTLDTHYDNYMDSQEGLNLPVIHCVKGTSGWNLNDDVQLALNEPKIYEKNTFGSKELALDLVELNKKEELEIELVGLCTDICVVSNALLIKAFLPENKISVDASCCAGVTPNKHNAALDTMELCQIKVINR